MRQKKAPAVLFFLTVAAALLCVSLPNPIRPARDIGERRSDIVFGKQERREASLKEEDDEEELFTEMDPQLLAAVLLKSLNRSQEARWTEELPANGGMEDIDLRVEGPVRRAEEEVEEEQDKKEAAVKDRNGRQELELLMATKGREQENQEAEERKREEEEERLTEKVASRTTSQMVPVQSLTPKASLETEAKKGPERPEHIIDEEAEEEGGQEEEQLNLEELKSLETVMKEFPRPGAATKREWTWQEQKKQEGGSSSRSHNEVLPVNKGSNLALSKKKLKWQEETQKALYLPKARGHLEDIYEANSIATAGNAAPDPQSLAEQDLLDEGASEEEEEEVELLSPEEEEAQARAEQEEMRRQAAEAQRAELEEEKLADIASDMLLRYMGRQSGGGSSGRKKYRGTSLSNVAAEDKRSDEEQQEVGTEDDDDIDPQTIDKLIEISSKLHLPADDVVDIINDVEKKKKKKDSWSEQQDSRWQRPLSPLGSSFSSPDRFSVAASDVPSRYPTAAQQPPSPNLLRTWFHDEPQAKPQSSWSVHQMPLLTSQNLWAKTQRPLSVKQGLLKSGYPFYPYMYPAYYHTKSYGAYHPVYLPPFSRPRSRFYLPKSVSFLGNAMGDTYYQAPSSRQYYGWVQPWIKKPPSGPSGLRETPYFLTSRPLSLHPWTYRPVHVPIPHTPAMWGKPSTPSSQKQFFHSVQEKSGTGKEGFRVPKTLLEKSYRGDLEKHFKNLLLKRPQIQD